MTFALTAAVISAVSVVGSASAQRAAGKAEEIALKERAKQEKLAAEANALQRQQELAETLSKNLVAMAQSGIAMEGSPQALGESIAENISASEGTIALSERLSQRQLKRAGDTAASLGNVQAAATLLGGAVDIGRAYKIDTQ